MYKLAFFSTSSRPIKSLEALAKNFDICLVVTKTDKFIGKSKEKTPNQIKIFALNNSIPVFEIEKFNFEKKNELKELLSLIKPDICVTFDFGYIIPKDLFDIPKFKFVNIHFSLLPKYRGASAVQFAILNDEIEYGITYHLIDANLDTGDILYQSIFPLDENFNSEQAYKFLFEKCQEEISDILSLHLQKKLTPRKQDDKLATYTYSPSNPKHTFIFKEDAYIQKIENERKLFRQIKAFNPWPKLNIELNTLLKLNQFRDYKLKNPLNNQILVKVNDAIFVNNTLEITEITISNGKNLQIKEFINGYLEKK